jgi:hypothetical protein
LASGAGFGSFERRDKKWIVLSRKVDGFHLHLGTFWKFCSRRQDNHAIFDSSGYAHGYFLSSIGWKCKEAKSWVVVQLQMLPEIRSDQPR